MSAKKTAADAPPDQAAPAATAAADPRSFEDRLARLEEISEQLRRGQLALEAATGLFEEGITLARGLEKELSRIERQVEILINAPDAPGETPILELFPELKD
jgi:exodeoxyribonuclease VII small subunit